MTVDQFADARPTLFSIAYRMLGSVMDAEDLVQDAYTRWQETNPAEIRSPQAFLTTIITRLCINHLQAARTRREVYVGPWLPEPLVTDPAPSALDHIELAESLSMAFMVLLERLSPTERAVFLLREVFAFDYVDIARIVEKSEANCRQLFARSRKHLEARQARFPVSPEKAERLVEQFSAAARGGNVDALVGILAEDITLWSDGGGKVAAALHPIHGSSHVARFVVGALAKFVPAGAVACMAKVNGQPGILSYVGGQPQAALVFDIAGDRISAVYVITNPDKLRSVPPRPVPADS
ncbi:MAG TPA: RNA polymerase sigma-70 factor [Gemmatimonadales bacterium]|nr:RNA polymerase sigma-70 factor [Gemmatimonadales bacterium]